MNETLIYVIYLLLISEKRELLFEGDLHCMNSAKKPYFKVCCTFKSEEVPLKLKCESGIKYTSIMLNVIIFIY